MQQEQKNYSLVKYLRECIEDLPLHEGPDKLKYKILKQEDAIRLNINTKGYPLILKKDALIKNLKLNSGDVVCILRDYQLNTSPYWTYRVVL